MEREAAIELSNEWYDLVRGDDALNAQSNNLMGALARLLPTTIQKGGAAIVNGAPSVIACDPTAVYMIGFAAMDNGKPGVSFARHPLTSDASVSGREDFDSERMARILHWRFTWPSGVEIAFTSITDRRGGWENGPDSADGVARYMVKVLGWELPPLGTSADSRYAVKRREGSE